MLPGHAVDPALLGIRLVAADDQTARFLAHVDQVIRIAQAGGGVRELIARHRLQGDMLVVDRGGGQVQAGHGGDARRPQAGSVDHMLAS